MIFLDKQKLEGFYQQQNCPETNVKRSSSGKKKIKLHGSETQIYTKKWRTSEKE